MFADETFEEKVLACLFRSREFCASGARHVKPSYFTNPVRHNCAHMAIKFWEDYQTTITSHAFVNGIKELVDTKRIAADDAALYAASFKGIKAADISDHAYILDKLIVFVKDREIRQLIENAVKKDLAKGDFRKIEDGMRHIMDISAIGDVEPVDYWDDLQIDARLKRREDERLCTSMGISTGIKKLDDALDKKGWYKKELYQVLGSAKAGKSMFLLWCANASAWQGFNCLYFTCETSTERLTDRMDAMNAKVEIRYLPDKCKEVADKIKSRKADGRVLFYEYPTKTLLATEIERQIKRQEAKGSPANMIVVDYADIMRPSRKYDSKWDEQASVYEELRRIASKYEIPVLTASQVNRSGGGKTIIKGSDTSGSYEKVAICDGTLTLCGSDDDIKSGQMLIHLSEFRNTAPCTLRIKTSYGMGMFYKEFVEEV